MMTTTRLLAVLCVFVSPPLAQAEDAPTAHKVAKSVRDFAFSTNPNLDAKIEFQIRKLDVKALWETMKMQVFDIHYLSVPDGTQFNGFVGVYHAGIISPLAPNLGGHGLMSGLIHNGELYYTFSYGSGLQLSRIARLKVTSGKLNRRDSGIFRVVNLFVSANSDGKVHVFTGEFKDFNHWEPGVDLGTIVETKSSEIQIVSPKGGIVDPTSIPVKTSGP